MLTHFPKEEVFFIRGGGLSNIGYTIKGSGNDIKCTETGYGILGGVGYAFWIGKSFNLTLNLDYSRQFYSGDIADSSNFTIAYLGFDWY